MRRSLGRKLKSTRGISRLMALLLALVVVMCVVISVPTVRYYWARYRSAACAAGLDTARRRLAEQFLSDGGQSAGEARDAVAYAMVGWDDLCPSGGKVYLVETESGESPYDLVCGLHDPDIRLRTRLNSGYVLEQLRDGLKESRKNGEPGPETLTFYLNGKRWKAWRTDTRCDFKWGTGIARGLEKLDAAAYYGIAGQGDFTAGNGVNDGGICYFTYAERSSFATWRAGHGWTGDSYAGR